MFSSQDSFTNTHQIALISTVRVGFLTTSSFSALICVKFKIPPRETSRRTAEISIIIHLLKPHPETRHLICLIIKSNFS